MNAEPALRDGAPGLADTVQRSLRVRCNHVDERYEIIHDGASSAGNTCFELSNEAPAEPANPLLTSLSYAVQHKHLFVISTSYYLDRQRGTILGTHERVQEYAPSDDPNALAIAQPRMQPGAAARDARCPTALPEEGTACSPDGRPLECEYVDDSRPNCSEFAQCALAADGGYSFRRDKAQRDACISTNPSACPSTLEDAQQLAETLPQEGTPEPMPACKYDTDACGCARYLSGGCIWRCRSIAELGDCPWPRPLAGEWCTRSRNCDYDFGCAEGLSLGPDMECRNGVWLQASDVAIGCPLSLTPPR